MKKIYIYLMAGLVLAGCSKATDTLTPQRIQEPESQQQQAPDAPDTPDTFTLKVETVATKALIDNGQTLGSEWKQGDSISVYNVTTEQAIEGWLYAEADGTSTTFSGTISGNFNQGDELFLEFLEPQYGIQDGTLEGLAGQSDWAVATVNVTAIDPEAKTIATNKAAFEKRQAVVRFNITNRKNPVEPVKVTTFYAYGGIPGGDKFSIKVSPKVASDELYVAIPNYEKMPVTFEAEGEDGFDYRLIVPDVNFEEGLYYRRTLQMKRRALVKAPVAKTGLKFNGAPQALVDSAHVYWMSNGQEVILDNDKDYQQDSCVIFYFIKKEVTAETVPTAPTATENGWLPSVPTQMHAGTYYIWTKMTGNYDYEDADVSENPVKVVIAKATAELNVSANINSLTYNGSSQSLLSGAAALKIGNTVVTTAEDAENKTCTILYYVSTSQTSATGGSWGTSYSATNADTLHVWVSVIGNKDINDISPAYKVSKVIAKKNPSFSLASSSVTFAASDNVNSTKTVNITYDGDGTLSASSSDATKATASISNKVLTITRKSGDAGTVTITVTPAAGANYNAATGKPVTVTLTANDTGVALKNAKVGDKVASNGKAYAPTASIPTGSELVGVIVKSGIVMKSVDQSVSYTRSNCEDESKGWNAETGDYYYINSLTENKTQKHWILVNADGYMDILGNGQINTVQAYLKNAGASTLSTGSPGYGCYCYNTQKYYFRVSSRGSNSYSVNFETWDAGSSKKVRLIFKY